MFDDSTVLYCKCRPSMETNLSAWIPTPPKTVSSTLLVLGLYKIYALYFPKVKLANEFCSFVCVPKFELKTLLYRGSLEFEDTMDLLNCTVGWKPLFENVCTNIQNEIYLMFIIFILDRYSSPGARLWSNRGHGAKKGQQYNVPKGWSCSSKVGIQLWLTTYRVLFLDAPPRSVPKLENALEPTRAALPWILS